MSGKTPQGLYDFSVKNIDGVDVPLSLYKDKVLLIVNVASKCGFTHQYKELEELYKTYQDRGLEILAFPCNQFGEQEPGNAEEIKTFCSLTYNVTFPLFAKVDVNGNNEAPLFHYLKQSLPGILGTKAVKWNFTKFLVDKNGTPVFRFAPNDKPKELTRDIEKLLRR